MRSISLRTNPPCFAAVQDLSAAPRYRILQVPAAELKAVKAPALPKPAAPGK